MADVKQEPEKVEFSTMESNNEVGIDGISEKCEVPMVGCVKSESLSCLKLEHSEFGVSENGLDKGNDGVVAKVGDLGCIVEEEMGKVSISGVVNERVVDQASNCMELAEADIAPRSIVSGSEGAAVGKSEQNDEVISVDERNVKGSTVNDDKSESDEDGSSDSGDTESESESSSSSSASSSDEEEEDETSSKEEVVEEVDMEDGEIHESDPDEMVAWDEDDEGAVVKGPIKSKNEVQVLPPVPAVTATLQPHHQMLPVGVVSSILGAQVVVEGVEKHTPLYDGSILWITESRSPLGIVDEIFGPVKNPYYIVRYNSDDEVPSGIQPGTFISFVPVFAKLVLNDNSLYKKGYDASNENDEEVSEEEEFSDDEKEAEYKRMLKTKKRGSTNDQKVGNKKKDKRKLKNRSQNWKHDQTAATDAQRGENAMPPVNQSQCFFPGAAGSPSSGVWTNGIQYQQPQNMGFPNPVLNVGMQWPQQSHPQQMFPMPLPNAVPFEQQINPTMPSGFIFPGGQPNFGAGPSFVPWPALGQNVFNRPPLAMGLPGQLAPTPMIFGGQVPVNGPQTGQNNNTQPHAAVPGHIDGSTNFNQGAHSGGGRRGNHRGGGRFGGRRGRTQRN